MAKCMVRWTDPSGRDGTRLCGRPVSHKGNHLSVGQDKSWTMWDRQGGLIMAVGFAANHTETTEQELGEEQA